jgi:hypothetical protein
MTAMDWTLTRPQSLCEHKLVRSSRNSSIVTCSECGEGTHYLFGFPGSKDAIALGCKCPEIDNHYGRGRGGEGSKYGWFTSTRCRLHTPADELEVES